MTQRVDYDGVASEYDRRYQTNWYLGVLEALAQFIGESDAVDAAELGCGTGHWLAEMRGRARAVTGLDLSIAMLQRARTAAPFARLVRGRADQLPWLGGRFDRVFCVNALHHFDEVERVLIEVRRVLRAGGAFLTVGLDPHAGNDRWLVYDYFPSTLETDRSRFLSTAAIRERLTAAGFVGAATGVAQHRPIEMPFEMAVERGHLDRRSKSQLMLLGDAEYAEGMRRLRAERPAFYADLRLYATTAHLP